MQIYLVVYLATHPSGKINVGSELAAARSEDEALGAAYSMGRRQVATVINDDRWTIKATAKHIPVDDMQQMLATVKRNGLRAV